MVQASHGFGPDEQLRFAHEHAEELRAEWQLVNRRTSDREADVPSGARMRRLVTAVRRTVGGAVVRAGRAIAYDEPTVVSFRGPVGVDGPDGRSRAA